MDWLVSIGKSKQVLHNERRESVLNTKWENAQKMNGSPFGPSICIFMVWWAPGLLFVTNADPPAASMCVDSIPLPILVQIANRNHRPMGKWQKWDILLNIYVI